MKAQLDREAMKDAEAKEKELVAELVVFLKKKVCCKPLMCFFSGAVRHCEDFLCRKAIYS